MANVHIVGVQHIKPALLSVRFAMHVPTEATAEVKAKAVADPAVYAFESSVPDVSSAELSAIRSGDLVEVLGDLQHNVLDPFEQLETRIMKEYAKQVSRVPLEFEHRYQWYGDELNYG